jgi:dTDP-glucose 4,6-dehydratase
MGRTILVTGGAGFIGSNFIRYWLTTHPDDHIVNLDALTYAGNTANLKDVDKNPHYHFIHGSIDNNLSVREALKNVDWIVNFAAESHVDRSITGPQTFLQTNVIGTQVLLDETLRHCPTIKRFHHVSTDEVFGSLTLDDPNRFTETTPYAPRSPYSASKAASDHLVRAYYHTYGLPISISNCSNNYGPYHFPEKFIPLCIVNALQNKPLPIYGDGKYVRDWIYVEDHCRGIEAILLNGAIGESYCLGGDAEPANIDVAKKILHLLNKPESLLTFVEDRKGHDRRYSIDDTKARTQLNWAPRTTFDQGLSQTVEWFKRNETWWKPLIK